MTPDDEVLERYVVREAGMSFGFHAIDGDVVPLEHQIANQHKAGIDDADRISSGLRDERRGGALRGRPQ